MLPWGHRGGRAEDGVPRAMQGERRAPGAQLQEGQEAPRGRRGRWPLVGLFRSKEVSGNSSTSLYT